MTDDLLPTGGLFDAIRRVDDRGEHWLARDLAPLLEYADFRNFADAIDRARAACSASGVPVHDQFGAATSMVPIGSGAHRPVHDVRLTRYACYLVAMNGDPRKRAIAAAQTYFAVRTRQAEVAAPRRELSRREMAAYWLDAEERAEREQVRRAAAEAHVAELEPAAHSWERLAETAGDYPLREAAQILSRDPRITTGQNRLSAFLREIGWCDHRGQPYQRAVDAGHLVRRVTDYQHPHRDERVPSSQVRVTVSGLHVLHRRLGGECPLLLATA